MTSEPVSPDTKPPLARQIFKGVLLILLAAWLCLAAWAEMPHPHEVTHQSGNQVSTTIEPARAMTAGETVVVWSLAGVATLLLVCGVALAAGGSKVQKLAARAGLGPIAENVRKDIGTALLVLVMRLAAFWRLGLGAYLYFLDGKTPRSHFHFLLFFWVGGLAMLALSLYVARRRPWSLWVTAALSIGLSLPVLAEHWEFLNWFLHQSLLSGVAIADWVLNGLLLLLSVAVLVLQWRRQENTPGNRLRLAVLAGGLLLMLAGAATALFLTRPASWYFDRWTLEEGQSHTRRVGDAVFKVPWMVEFSPETVVLRYGSHSDPLVDIYRVKERRVDAPSGTFLIEAECDTPDPRISPERRFSFQKEGTCLRAVDPQGDQWQKAAIYNRMAE